MDILVISLYVIALVPLLINAFRAFKGQIKCDDDLYPTSRQWIKSLLISLVLLSALGAFHISLWVHTEALWFEELRFSDVFWTVLSAKWVIYPVSILIIAVILWLMTAGIPQMAPPLPAEYEGEWIKRTKILKFMRWLAIVIVSPLIALYPLSSWKEILMYFNQEASSVSDPIFQKDLSFYMFSYPFFSDVITLLFICFTVGVIMAAIMYFFFYVRTLAGSIWRYDGSNIDHKGKKYRRADYYVRNMIKGAMLRSLGLLFLAFLYFWLSIYGVMYANRGAVVGAGYTDVNAQVPAYVAFMVFTVATIIAMAIAAFQYRRKLGIWIGVIWVFFYFLLVLLIPVLTQAITVKPSELDKEKRFLEYNIKYTRQGFGIDKVEEKNFPSSDQLSLTDLRHNQTTLDNVRLWDWRALEPSYAQQQEIRLYYSFSDIDIDRYVINGQYRQVMLSAREMNIDELVEQSRTWVNEKLKYTHGYGLCLNQVTEFETNGDPKLIVKDFPPVSSAPEIKITRPEVYYGEMTKSHVYVKTGTPEFDYPRGDDNVECIYSGTGGIPIGSGLRKLAFALRFDGFKTLLSEYLKPASRIMYRREIFERLNSIAPFLSYSSDAYITISGGRLYWICDAYTTSSYYPYSEKHHGVNYIRNSVKAVVDAYNGNVSFYIFDDKDVVLKTWRNVFPTLFKPRSAMPSELLAHIRYPEYFLSLQSEVYGTYHMSDPQVFYNREDAWTKANEVYSDGPQPISPSYVIIKLPGSKKEEYVLMLPFTPKSKRNLIGWVAGRCDGEEYGKLLVYKMPKDNFVLGPELFETKIDQNGEMSSQLSLWKQKGSDVIRGNTLVIPINDALLYVEPIYLKATSSPMPQLQKVVIGFGNNIVWADDFKSALEMLFNGSRALSSAQPESGGNAKSPAPISDKQAYKNAQQQYNQYQKLMGEGKYQQAGKALEELGRTLNSLNK